MNRYDNQRIAEETMKIVKDGFYEIDGQKHYLTYNLSRLEEVEVFSPERVDKIVCDKDGFFQNKFYKHPSCEYRVVNMDSYEAAYRFSYNGRTLVMNFANARHPGGGFLHGASAQEESLCRCSTLFASIGSSKAREMYDYNKMVSSPFDSDYMLISPYVEVFRKADGSLIDDSFTTSVLTIPAPNLNGRASGAGREKLKEVMKDKIRKFMKVSARYLYDTLILGAWGCGAFGHDAKDIAECFKEIIEEEKYYQYFEKIIFAVYDRTHEGYNYNSFVDAFGEHGIWKDEGNEQAVISVDYKQDGKYRNESGLICEEAMADSYEQVNEIVNDYLSDDRVKRIEIVK